MSFPTRCSEATATATPVPREKPQATMRSGLSEPWKRSASHGCPWYSPAPIETEPS